MSFALSSLYHISRGDPKGEIKRCIEPNQARTSIDQGARKAIPQHDEILQRLRLLDIDVFDQTSVMNSCWLSLA
jgi:hypothetical protein